MSSEKRLVLFMVLTFFSFLAVQYLMDVTGLTPPPPKPLPKAQAKAGPLLDAGKPKDAQREPAAKGEDPRKKADGGKGNDREKAKPREPAIALLQPSEMVLGSARDKTPQGYRIEVRLEQKGAGVSSVASSRYDADVDGRRQAGKPLQLIQYDPRALPSFAMSLKDAQPDRPPVDTPDDAAAVGIPAAGEIPLAEVLWEVVRDEKGRAVRPVSRVDPATKAAVQGQEILFRTEVSERGVTLTKRFRLWQGADGFELELGFASPSTPRSLVYRLYGPHGIPIEGEWYTGTFRDVFLGQVKGSSTEILNKSAAEIAKPKADRFENTTLPLHFAGIENQYFAVFLEPAPTAQGERWDSETVATIVDAKPDALPKADISVELLSKPVNVGPNQSVTQTYRVFTGPKTFEALAPYGAEGLASYRKTGWFFIPGAGRMAMYVIAPLLDRIYALTTQVARLFGGTRGNYGLSIILLTLLVRMLMFPLGRKQAMAAKKMQDLQPQIKEIQEKYKDDKERQGRETWALYNKHGANPIAGCLPALIQLPIFVGLWQALNNSVHLRHASFLYIANLAAPDMLFRFPGEVPFLGHFFNLLPFVVVSLMLVQTKLFAPPATTPETEMQQKMMKYMMVFMGFMFYKVPSGLGLYFITSSTWQICERLLLPKVTHTPPAAGGGDDRNLPGGGGGRGGPGGNGAPDKPAGKLAQFWEKVKEEATKDPTYRKLSEERDRGKDRDKGKGNPKARPGRRR